MECHTPPGSMPPLREGAAPENECQSLRRRSSPRWCIPTTPPLSHSLRSSHIEVARCLTSGVLCKWCQAGPAAAKERVTRVSSFSRASSRMVVGEMGGSRAASWMLFAVLAGAAAAASTTPTDTKRSGEDIQFGNQQNPPVSLLDDNAMAGAFPSSETSEEAPTQQEGAHEQQKATEAEEAAAAAKAVVEGFKQEQQQKQEKQQQQQTPQEEQQREKQEDEEEESAGKERESAEVEEEEKRAQQQQQEIPAGVGEDQGWDDEANLWHSQPAAHDLYRTYLSAPLHISGALPSFASRNRRSLHLPPLRSHPIKGGTLAGVRNLLGRGPQRQKRDLRRFRRDLNMNGLDLDRLLKNVDMKELLALISRPQHHQEGYGTVHYAPAPARYAPQPKLFPDYEEEWGESAEDLLRQSLRAERPVADEVVMPPNRVWRKSGAPPGYGLARVPGFKRSSVFRANTLQDTQPQPARPFPALNPRDVYSLAAMLGADRDPFSNRIRRAVM
ncbi:uncharacterized protein LOC127008894 isoform X3 [Eriocheir sinensis]|uniref:uncharacterized protein LOC127008894 isoform X3 n=1 Tax=Eriocheir sinensis TaxID=95602 RepID=UPI0021C7DB84|nr:uncharacterized protein LOC127008894 isoform X3 [Eriocheir sinensis]